MEIIGKPYLWLEIYGIVKKIILSYMKLILSMITFYLNQSLMYSPSFIISCGTEIRSILSTPFLCFCSLSLFNLHHQLIFYYYNNQFY